MNKLIVRFLKEYFIDERVSIPKDNVSLYECYSLIIAGLARLELIC